MITTRKRKLNKNCLTRQVEYESHPETDFGTRLELWNTLKWDDLIEHVKVAGWHVKQSVHPLMYLFIYLHMIVHLLPVVQLRPTCAFFGLIWEPENLMEIALRVKLFLLLQ